MNPSTNHCPLTKFTVWSLAVDSILQIFRPFGHFSPVTPFSPPSGPATGSFNGLHHKSNFLAVISLIGELFLFTPQYAHAQIENAGLSLKLLSASSNGNAALVHTSDAGLFCYVDVSTGQSRQISEIPYTGYFSSISPDGKFVCYKHFQQNGEKWMSFPAIYDLSQDVVIPLAKATVRSGNPTMSKNGLVAITSENKLIILSEKHEIITSMDLGFFANHLAFSHDEQHLALTDENEALWIVDLASKAPFPRLIAKDAGFRPAYSPDDLYLSAQQANGHVNVVDLLNSEVISVGEGSDPQWCATINCLTFKNFHEESPAEDRSDLVGVEIRSDHSIKTMFREPIVEGNFTANGNTVLRISSKGRLLKGAALATGIEWTEKSILTGLLQPLKESLLTQSTPEKEILKGPLSAIGISGTVPYVHQVLDRDTSAGFSGQNACGPTSALMTILYYGKLSSTSPSGWYLSNQYNYNGYTYSSQAQNQADAGWVDIGSRGGYGFYLRTSGGTSISRRDNLYTYIEQHGITSGWAEASVSQSRAQQEIDLGYPLLWLITKDGKTSGHYIVCIGYESTNSTYKFNDPYGNMNLSGWGTIKNGSGVWYAWPGTNGAPYLVLTSVPRFIWARSSGVTDTTKPTFSAFTVSTSSITQGSSVTISYTVSDSGGSGLAFAQLWRTTDSNGSPNESNWFQIGSDQSLTSYGNGPVSKTFTDGSSLSPGIYWYGVHANDNSASGNPATETTSGLSRKKVTVTATATIDLTQEDPATTPSTLTIGSSFDFSSNVRNNGAASSGSFRIDFYLSSNTTISTSDTALGSTTVSSIAGGQSRSYSTTLSVPSGVTPGNYYIGWIIDAGSAVSETDESNNIFYLNSTRSVVAPATRTISLSGSLAFGNVVVGSSSGATMTISNTGNSTLTVSGITYPNGFSGNWSSGTIAAGNSQNVAVTFSPSAATSYGGTITVTSDKTSGTNTISCSGTGTAVATRVISLSGSLAFGNVVVGSSSGATMTISNTGNSTLTVSGITYPSGFSGNWSSGTIAAGNSQNVAVTFSPSAATSHGGTITVTSDKTSGTNTISCSGTGMVSGVVFFDDMENGQGAWGIQTPWGLTTASSHSASHAWTDSPGGNYENNTNVSLNSQLIDLSGKTTATLTFWHRFDFAAGDGGYIWILPEGGAFTSPFCSLYGTNLAWHQEIVDLNSYVGQRVQIFFQMLTDASGVADGWYIDDVSVTGVSNDDHGDRMATATQLALGSGMAGVLTAGDEDFFRVTVPGPGILIAWTEGDTDTYGYLYDSSSAWLAEDDDSNIGFNFRQSSAVVAGNYFICVKGYNSATTGSYNVCSRFIPITDPIQISYLEKAGSFVNLGFTSIAGVPYTIQASDDLKTWTTVTTMTGTGAENYASLDGLGVQPNKYFRVSYTQSALVGFSLIPAGTFQMGDQSNPLVGSSSELPVHTVQVSAFYMSKYEVTKALWDEVRSWGLTHNYTDLAAGWGKASNHPVQTITWYDMVKWCNARSEKEGLTPCYTLSGTVYRTTNNSGVTCNWNSNGYRLPTEAEWEKAARGGLTAQNFPWGNTISHTQANYYSDSSYAYDVSPTRGYHPTYNDGGSPYTSPVGSFAPNGYGLYDMAGNVWEGCWDWYSSSYYASSPGVDPRGASSGSFRMCLGGGWTNFAGDCRVATRYCRDPSDPHEAIGFRVVRYSVP
jgi:formylglycine-generating enzyme required for sulfatase activity/uncharacterized membrane protein